MKRIITITVLLLCMCHICRAADGLRIDENFQIAPGETGKGLNLILDDEAGKYCGLEFWLYLPEGISISKDEDDDFICNPSNAAKKHVFDIAQEADGSYHFLIYKSDNKLLGNGVFCTLTVEASSSVEVGQANGKFKEVVISDAGGNGPEFDEIPFTVTIKAAEPEVIPVTIGDTGFATLYYAEKALTVPEGVEAYVVMQTDIDGGFEGWTATYASGSTIPAGEPVVLKGEQGDYDFEEASSSSAVAAGNLLRGCDVAAVTTAPGSGDYHFYMLSTDANDENVGFYYGNDDGSAFECQDHKAYLALPAAASTRCYPFSAGQGTGVGIVNYQLSIINYFDLSGRKISGKPVKKGVYVRNGRKEVVR